MLNWFIEYWFSSSSKIIHIETSPLTVKPRLRHLTFARRLGPLSREGSLSCHTCYDTGPRLTRSHQVFIVRWVSLITICPKIIQDHFLVQLFAINWCEKGSFSSPFCLVASCGKPGLLRIYSNRDSHGTYR